MSDSDAPSERPRARRVGATAPPLPGQIPSWPEIDQPEPPPEAYGVPVQAAATVEPRPAPPPPLTLGLALTPHERAYSGCAGMGRISSSLPPVRGVARCGDAREPHAVICVGVVRIDADADTNDGDDDDQVADVLELHDSSGGVEVVLDYGPHGECSCADFERDWDCPHLAALAHHAMARFARDYTPTAPLDPAAAAARDEEEVADGNR